MNLYCSYNYHGQLSYSFESSNLIEIHGGKIDFMGNWSTDFDLLQFIVGNKERIIRIP